MANSSHHLWRILFLLALAGCGRGYNGPERASVLGRVTMDGKAVESGIIEFVPAADTPGPTAGAKINNGVYEVAEKNGPVLGKYLVRIHSHGKTGRKISAGSLEPAGALIEEVGEMVPAQYNEKTTLEREVVSGENQFDFDLKSN